MTFTTWNIEDSGSSWHGLRYLGQSENYIVEAVRDMGF